MTSVRARLQPCHNLHEILAASAAEDFFLRPLPSKSFVVWASRTILRDPPKRPVFSSARERECRPRSGAPAPSLAGRRAAGRVGRPTFFRGSVSNNYRGAATSSCFALGISSGHASGSHSTTRASSFTRRFPAAIGGGRRIQTGQAACSALQCRAGEVCTGTAQTLRKG
jgi:hypothetical protein